MQSVFVQLESAWVHFTTWEEIHRAFFILYFNVLIIAHQKSSFRQFENMLDVTHWANHLTGSDILNVCPAGN